MEREMVEIDISIVTCNSSKWIDMFRDSLMNQNYPKKKINVYITDNSSNDDTYSRLQNLKNEIGEVFNNFEIYSRKNLGFGHGHNNNICNSNSEFILVTNLDLEFEQNAIINVVEVAINDESSAGSWELRQKPFEHPKDFNPVTLETTWSSSACILFRREALNKVGGYEKRIFMYGEDVELSYRLRDAGYKLKYCPKAVCWHYTYEYENQVKPLQFLGSTLGNLYIRLRFGNLFDIIKGFVMYYGLFFIPEMFDGQRKDLFKNFIKLLNNMPYFLFTRKKSNHKFEFFGWDYQFLRDGAFYSYSVNANQEEKLISVIMRTYGDRLNYLRESVTSVFNQTYSNIELVIIEDGTKNAEQYINSIQLANVKNIIYKSIPKSGRCKAGNIGLSLANGDYLVFLDDDDVFYPDHLEVLAAELFANTSIYAAYSNAFEAPTKIVSNNPLRYIELAHNIIYRQKFSRPLIWHHNYIPIQAILFRRELYEKYGGFDEQLDNLEDWNLWTRYSLNHDFKYIEKTTSLYRVPANKEDLLKRQQNLDFYYNKAIEKQKELYVSTNVGEIIQFYKEINDNVNVFRVTVSDIKCVLKKYNKINKIYYFARKLYYKFKR